ncbi:hypothetical protein [Microcystis phage Mel-JY01]
MSTVEKCRVTPLGYDGNPNECIIFDNTVFDMHFINESKWEDFFNVSETTHYMGDTVELLTKHGSPRANEILAALSYAITEKVDEMAHIYFSSIGETDYSSYQIYPGATSVDFLYITPGFASAQKVRKAKEKNPYNDHGSFPDIYFKRSGKYGNDWFMSVGHLTRVGHYIYNRPYLAFDFTAGMYVLVDIVLIDTDFTSKRKRQGFKMCLSFNELLDGILKKIEG